MEELFTKEDIEKFRFLYEPNSSKYKMYNSGIHYDCNYYKDNEWTTRTTPVIDDEWKEWASKTIRSKMSFNYKYINSIFVLPVSPLSGQGVMCRRVFIKGC